MRTLLTKLNSTKAERIFAERLKLLHITFQHRVKINNREIDFLVGHYAIDIDGHDQDSSKNKMLLENGLTPLHIENRYVKTINISYLNE